MIPGSANPLLLASAAAAPAGYAISRSLRFNSADSAYLSRTPASAGNRKTWTWAGWVKRSGTASTACLFSARDGVAYTQLLIQSDNKLSFDLEATGQSRTYVATSAVFRDFSAWYHIVFTLDTTQAIASSRAKIYVNGVEQITSGSFNQNVDHAVNSIVAHNISRRVSDSDQYFSGYLADVHFIDGQALDPTSFGFFDSNGIWQPKAYTGTYGTNGFHLTFSDNSTAGSLGDDSSGNDNNWTVNNISVAAGAGNDSLVDVPTNGTETDSGIGGEVRGNYCTLNPLDNGGITLANGNLDASRSTGSWASVRATIGISSGKWYWEATATSGTNLAVGISKSSAAQGTNNYVGVDANGWGYIYTGDKYTNGSASAYGVTYTNGDVIGIAFDADAGTLTFYKNNSSQGTAFTGLTSGPYFPAVSNYSSGWTLNFGARSFAYTAPSGFKALCTANLPSTTITTSGSYTGNGVADGPFVYLNGVPTAMTVNGNAVTFGTHADKLSNGFKIRTTSTTFNQNASTYNYSITSTGDPFKTARAQAN